MLDVLGLGYFWVYFGGFWNFQKRAVQSTLCKLHNRVWQELSHDAPVALGVHDVTHDGVATVPGRTASADSVVVFFFRRSVGCGLLPRRGVGEDYGRGASDAAVYSSGSAGVYIFMTRNYADVQRNLLLSLQKQPFTRHIDPVLSVTSIKQSNAPGSAIVSRRTSVRDSLLSPR